MPLHNIGLGRLLRIMYSDRSDRIAVLRADIRDQIAQDKGGVKKDPRDFYLPFWADVKRHIAGGADLKTATADRIEKKPDRKRLYEVLESGFLIWWNEKRRQRNVPLIVISDSVKARYVFEGLGVVRVENTLSIDVGNDTKRVIYPYFAESPSLSDEAARLGLWLMSVCVENYSAESMTILDVIHSRAFSMQDVQLLGDEENLFWRKYTEIIEEREYLKDKYYK